MIPYIASYILIFPVPEWRIRSVTFSSTGDCDTWDCKRVQGYFFLKETDIGHEAFESSSHRRLQTIVCPLIMLSISLSTFAKPLSSGPMVEEGLGLMKRNSWKLGHSPSLNLYLTGCRGQLRHINSSTCCFSAFLMWYCLESARYTLPSHNISSRWVLIYFLMRQLKSSIQ